MDITVKYKQVSTRPFVELCNRLKYFETNNKAASHINHILGQIKKASEQVKKEYDTEIMEKFADRDENGKIKPHGELLFTPKAGMEEDFKKAQDEFLDREYVIKWKPLNPDTLEGFSLSANDLELLGNLFSERVGPGIPNISNFPGPKSLSPN